MSVTTTEATAEITKTEDVFEPLNFVLFWAIVLATLVGIPLYGYYVGFSLFDWVLFLVMYIVTGMGITVGYHRLVSHQSFECPNWVKAAILVAGGWAMQNSALIWELTISAIMPRLMRKKTPTMPKGDSGTATAAGSFTIHRTARRSMRFASAAIRS